MVSINRLCCSCSGQGCDAVPAYPSRSGTSKLNRRLAYLPRLIGVLWLVATPLECGVVPPTGTVNLSIRVDGGTVQVDLSAAALTLVGFNGAPASLAQRQDLELAQENLRKGDALVRFNPQAQCVLETAKVDADPRPRNDKADLGASYRFGCVLPGSLNSAALGVFAGFPAVERVHVHYATAQGQGAAVLTPGNPVVTFVPLQGHLTAVGGR